MVDLIRAIESRYVENKILIEQENQAPVSYTHLDVYKRQILYCL